MVAGATDSSNLATLALLGGLGGGSPGYYPSPSGYSNVPAGRKRRSNEECIEGEENSDRKRRQAETTPCPEGQNCDNDRRRRQATPCPKGEICPGDRKRRSSNCRDPEDDVCCVDGKWLCF